MKMGAVYAALAFVGLGAFMINDSRKPRGIRNNNPLNIRDNPSNQWNGKIGTDDKNFVVFDYPENGYRAATKILQSYAKRGIVTLHDIISNWSPPVGMDADGKTYENPTANYIDGVSDKTGIAANAVVNESDYSVLLMAMTFHENGLFPYSLDTIKRGIGEA